MEEREGKPFLEVFSSALHEDYRFPILEIFAFLYVLGTFVLVNVNIPGMYSNLTPEATAYRLVSSAISVSLFVFLLLMFKNLAFGLGSDMEKGIMQTYFSYPLKRSKILTAKLLSAIGVSILLFLAIQIIALSVIAPGIIWPNIGTVLLSYAGSLSYPLIIAGVLLLVAMFTKRGSIALIIGIVLYFALSIVSGIVAIVSLVTKSALPLQILSFFSPSTALSQYYSGTISSVSSVVWQPSMLEVILSIAGSYVIAAVLFGFGYYYFSRRLSL